MAWFMFILCVLFCSFHVLLANDLSKFINISWGDGRGQMVNNNELLTLILDRGSGSGFESKNEYLFAKVQMRIKLVSGNSAGTVTTFFLSSKGDYHDEIDFEFLGNTSGNPYIVHTNVFCEGIGNREMQFYLWFDPTADFHNYTIFWNHQHIVFYVDDIPIREFKNFQDKGVPFPQYQAMRLYSSLWDADNWATRGGLEKTDWSQAPFKAYYENYNEDGCFWYNGYSSCTPNSNSWLWGNFDYDYAMKGQMKWVQDNYMIYSYCQDSKKFPQGYPLECYLNTY
ncbi:probable xyloglucan endotransglucosylase/hydrolase protein 23 [Cucumis sativus]|nr:probable xyloglucan endotransglucosylase/hydrolase protein 23 [Cucumis sativus]KGN61121.2 hypothetical protein Csa_021343 [Cucumis sativus]